MLIQNYKSIQQSILKVRMNNTMLWLTPDVDCWMVWEKKFDLGTKNNVLVEKISNFRILEKNIFKRGINGLTKC